MQKYDSHFIFEEVGKYNFKIYLIQKSIENLKGMALIHGVH